MKYFKCDNCKKCFKPTKINGQSYAVRGLHSQKFVYPHPMILNMMGVR